MTKKITETVEQLIEMPNCWCGKAMTAIGNGKYPYECIAKDKRPDAMVYEAIDCGHNGWTSGK